MKNNIVKKLLYAFIFIISVVMLWLINDQSIDSIAVTFPALILISIVNIIFEKRKMSTTMPLICGILLSAINILFESRKCDPIIGAHFSFSVLIYNQWVTIAFSLILFVALLIVKNYCFQNDCFELNKKNRKE